MKSPAGHRGRRVHRLPFRADRFATAAALASAAAGPYMVYENDGTVCWAEGAKATVTARGGGAVLDVGGERREFEPGSSPLDAVGEALDALPYSGWRAYGWLSFELSHALHLPEPVPPATPVAHLTVPRWEIRLGPDVAELRADDDAGLNALRERLARAIRDGAAGPAPERVAVDADGHDADAYRKAVGEALREIGAGRLEKVILSRTVPVDGGLDLPATYLAGRRGNSPARSFLLRLGGWEAAGFSPEIVVRVTADGWVATQPLAGTRAFEGDAAADAARRRELYRDAKEVYEHAISVRLAAEELGEVCEPGTVRVRDFMSVKERGSVQHLASELSGRLRPGAGPWDALARLFPAVTVSGIPKAAACELIRRHEGTDRGLYGGAVLTADADGTIDAALVLRTVFRRGGRTWLRAGAGIVAQSSPGRELEETREKLRSVSRFLVPAGGAS
ncbi:salicylate synthase [Thermopolyspora sp. NPDC052614]|uniref:salicylate synthase n=1 Tax=Thermopolyspora sp. NPDC052614 TaxID=3155682 RepID=UPI00343CEFC8